MKVKATEITGKDLKTGELFSTAPQNYWDEVWENGQTIGEKVYIRTPRPCPEDQRDVAICRIELEGDND